MSDFTPQMGRPKGNNARRLAIYLMGVAIGLIMVGMINSLRRAAEAPAPIGAELESGPDAGGTVGPASTEGGAPGNPSNPTSRPAPEP